MIQFQEFEYAKDFTIRKFGTNHNKKFCELDPLP